MTAERILWKPIGERSFFKDRYEQKYEFVDYWKQNSILRAWLTSKPNEMTLSFIRAQDVPASELKTLEIWDLLSDTIKQEIEGLDKVEDIEAHEVMAHARKHRKGNPEYAGLPRMIKCNNCNKEQYIGPAMLLKKIQLKKVTTEEFVKDFVCSKCKPMHRGKKPSAKYINMVRELHCHHDGCTFVKPQHPSATEKQAKSSGKTYQEFVDTWLCREHRVKKAHYFSTEARENRGEGKKGRAVNPEYIEVPKETTCKGCGKVVQLVPSNIVGKAKVLKITVKELVENYRCRSCGGRLKGVKKNKKGMKVK